MSTRQRRPDAVAGVVGPDPRRLALRRRRAASRVASSAFEGDPAARTVDEILFCYPGIHAILYHRIAHELFTLGVPVIARVLAELAHGATGIDIHPGARIGGSFFIDHGTGVVIGETSRIGERVRLYQGVTLGARRFPRDERGVLIKGLPRHPTIEDDVVIYAGATVLGAITVGRGSSIGGNVWVTQSVPPGSVVTQARSLSELFEDGAGILFSCYAAPVMAAPEPRIIGRYALHGEIASGGMATVHLGRLLGQVGFSRTVAIKRLHPQFAKDLDFVAMFLEEARLAARIQHPNVVQTLDVEASGDELLLVLEFVLGESLARLIRASYQTSVALPIPVILGILANALDGLHAAHEARSEQGEPLGIVHRDVSPQNILVGADGVARVLDFGIAKATRRSEQTRSGMLKGKVAYMPPEQLKGGGIDRRTDIYAASVVLWETLTGYRLFDGEDDFQVANKILTEAPPPPSPYRQDIPPALDAAVLQGLARDPKDRYPSALDMIVALEAVVPLASSREIARWVDRIAGASLRQRSDLVAEVERQTESTTPDRASLLRIPASVPRPSVVQPRPPAAPPRPSFVSSRPSFLRSPGDPPAQRTPLPVSQGTKAPVPPPPASRPPGPSLAPIPVPPSLRRPASSPRLSEPPAPPTEEPPTLPPPAPVAEIAASPPAPAPPPEPPVEALPGAPLEALPEVLAEPPADSLPEPPAPVETAVAGVAPFAPEATVAQVPLAELLAATNLSGGPEPGGSSQISSVSIIRPPSLRAPRPGLRWGLLGAAALLLLGVGLWFRSSGAEQKKVAPEVASPVDAVASGSAEPAPTAVDPPSEPVPPPVVSAEPSAGVSSEPPPPSSVKPAVKVPPTPRKNNCNPPYTIDKKGIKRIKPECA